MKEDKTEQHWDKLLHIRTSGRDDSHSDQYRYPYEPTPYTVLQRLADSGYIRKHNLLLDYGCGKGRVDFFLSWQTRCQSVGIEYDERIYENAQKNKETAVSSGRQFLPDGYLLKKWMRQNSLSRIRRTGCIFLIRFL